jgi:hypothetical protein
MKQQWILASGTALSTLLLALLLLRWLAPQLLGIPADLQLVRVAREVPPFFEGVFREQDFTTENYILQDPYVKRARPLYPDVGTMGPNDLLGFRNPGIPNFADLIAIGDSQTYGNNVVLENAWPQQLQATVEPSISFYSMAVGGWGAVEYFEIFPKALHFQPQRVVVAFYTGNDPLESVQLAYADERWRQLRPEGEAPMLPAIRFPPGESDGWEVQFGDGVHTVFTPGYRLASNSASDTVTAGYSIMAEVARQIGSLAREAGVQLIFTIVPTKELVYARKVAGEANLIVRNEYSQLVAAEAERLRWLAAKLQEVPQALYVDLVDALQAAALEEAPLYPTNLNGHPIASGYRVIAATLAAGLRGHPPAPREPGEEKVDRLFARAFAAQRNGQIQVALHLYERVLGLDAGHGQAAFNLAYALLEKAPADLRRACEVLQALAERRPDYTEVLFRLGEAHRQRGDRALAADYYRRYLEAAGHPDLDRRAQQWLEAWR